MTKVAVPDPVAYLYVHGEQEGVRLHKCSEMGLYAGTIEHGLITTDQAEAYADARVTGALEEAINLSSMYGATIELDAAIRALIKKE